MRAYDDDRYTQWVAELGDLVYEFLDTEGNTEESLADEIQNAVENARGEINPDHAFSEEREPKA